MTQGKTTKWKYRKTGRGLLGKVCEFPCGHRTGRKHYQELTAFRKLMSYTDIQQGRHKKVSSFMWRCAAKAETSK